MNVIKNIWIKYRQQKLWVQIFIGLTLISLVGAATGSGSSTSEVTHSAKASSGSASATDQPTSDASPTPSEESAPDEKELTAYKAAFSRLRIKKDSVTNKTWYYARSTTSYVDVNSFHLYMGKDKGSDPYLRWKIQYAGDDWLFIKKFTFNVDGNISVYDDVYSDIERDNDSNVWEWYDVVPNDSDISLIESIIKSKKAVYRSEGDQYYKDRTISDKEKSALKDILTVYYGLLKGFDKIK